MSTLETRDSDGSRPPLRVLHIEDSPRDAKHFSKCLEQAGFDLSADVVATPDEFLSALRSAPYDIILADYHLPNWSGIEALQTLQREGKDIPFILVTGTIGEEIAVECIRQGATDYVLKDRPARLSLAVRRALDERAAREEHKKAERSRDLLASIVESSDDAIIGITPDGAVLSWNRGAARLYGYAAQEVQTRPFAVLFAPDRAEELQKVIEAVLRGESVDRYETKGTRENGDVIDVVVTMSPIRDAGGDLAGASAIIRDITEQKRLQSEFFLAQKMEAVGQLAAGVAHDFNNLLTVVTGYSSLVLGHLKEQDPLYVEILEINKAAERAASLTRQLLAFSRKQVLRPRVVDLNGIVTDMDRMLRRLIGEDIDLLTVLDPGLGSIKADPGQIEQVIMNLAVNARDAMPNGGKLTITTVNVDLEKTHDWRHLAVSPGAYVMVAVTDSGTGMDAETQARIFEPFFTTKGLGQGTGLGLATVHGIVKQSGGAIIVYSELGCGTAFKIYLPMVQGAPASVDAAPVVAPPRGTETVLVVEDEDAVRMLVCQILQQQGYSVLRARNGGEALLMCEHHPDQIDLILTDVVMPAMSGSELVKRLLSQCPEMKIIFMSGYSGEAVVHHSVLAPDTDFLEKPFAPQDLARKVREVLDRTDH